MSITKKGQKIGTRISRIIRESLHTFTKVEVREYHELCITFSLDYVIQYMYVHMSRMCFYIPSEGHGAEISRSRTMQTTVR